MPSHETVDAVGKTVVPGVIDARAHATPPANEAAIGFGVTTEMDRGRYRASVVAV